MTNEVSPPLLEPKAGLVGLEKFCRFYVCVLRTLFPLRNRFLFERSDGTSLSSWLQRENKQKS